MATSTVIDWKQYFDHIYCLHYLPHKDRLPIITKELDRVGILKSGIFEFYWSYPFPFYDIVRKLSIFKNINFVNGQVNATTNIALSNYRIAKESLELNYKKILILEDDALFIHDLGRIKVLLEHLPPDWQFIQFDRAYQDNDLLKYDKYNEYFHCNYSGGFTSAACNAYSEFGLKTIIELLERSLYCADRLLANNPDVNLSHLKRYVAVYNVVKQDDRRYDDGYRDLLDFNDFYPRLT